MQFIRNIIDYLSGKPDPTVVLTAPERAAKDHFDRLLTDGLTVGTAAFVAIHHMHRADRSARFTAWLSHGSLTLDEETRLVVLAA